MENDSPNLFDSEPVSVKLTAAAAPDPVDYDGALDEIVGEVRGRPSVEITGGDAVEYGTDETDDENDGEDVAPDDGSADPDRSAGGERDGDPAKSKTAAKDVHKGLPPGRVKLIMKMDPDVNIVAGDAVFLLTKATESFVALLAQHCHKAMVASNKKTLKKQHIDAVIEENVPFEFLDGALDW